MLNSLLPEQRLAKYLSLLIVPDLVGGEAKDLFHMFNPAQDLRLDLPDCQRCRKGSIWLRYGVQHGQRAINPRRTTPRGLPAPLRRDTAETPMSRRMIGLRIG